MTSSMNLWSTTPSGYWHRALEFSSFKSMSFIHYLVWGIFLWPQEQTKTWLNRISGQIYIRSLFNCLTLSRGSGIPPNRFYTMAFTPSARCPLKCLKFYLRKKGRRETMILMALSLIMKTEVSVSAFLCGIFLLLGELASLVLLSRRSA